MTLVETVYTFHTGTKLIAVGTVLMIIGRIVFGVLGGGGGGEVTPMPTPVLSSLPSAKVPRLEIASLDISPQVEPAYVLDLITAVLPAKPQVAKVYPVVQPKIGFLSGEKARKVAEKFGFKNDASLSGINYIWEDAERRLEVDGKTLNFIYEYKYARDPSLFSAGSIFSTEGALTTAQEILRNWGLLGNFRVGKPRYQLLKYSAGTLVSTASLEEASAVRVDFPRASLESYLVLGSSPLFDNVYVIFTGNPGKRGGYGRILKFSSTRWFLKEEEAEEYPLKTAQAAWDQFKATGQSLVELLPEGGDPLAPYTPRSVREFRAREVFLAYFNPPKQPRYLQPIWVFKGRAVLANDQKADWEAYVPAVSDEWVE